MEIQMEGNYQRQRGLKKLLRANPPIEEVLPQEKCRIIIIAVIVSLVLLVSTFVCVEVFGQKIPEVDCIIGEASGEGAAGMVAIGQAIKNRGTIKGVAGCHAKHNRYESQDTIDLARLTWLLLNHGIISGGIGDANSWGTQGDIDKNHMDEKCFMIVKIGSHYFFKCDLGRNYGKHKN